MIIENIDQLIEKLEEIREKHGNIKVKYWDKEFETRDNLHLEVETTKGYGMATTRVNFY